MLDAAGSTSSRRGRSGGLHDTPLFDELGRYHRVIMTTSPQAQAYFSQGLRLVYGSLLGVAQSLRAQGKTTDASTVDAPFRVAWRRADVTLTSSRL